MAKKNVRGTKSKIVSAAWKLFYEQGYDDTTVEEIVELSGTSKGSFYHYFEGKDALLSSLSYLFDEEYDRLITTFTDEMSAWDKLLYLNHQLFLMIENSISLDLLARLYSSQLVTAGEKHLLDHNRTYYKLLRQICGDGIKNGEFRGDISVNELVKAYATFERGVLYDWCICGGNYALATYTARMLPLFLAGFRA